MLISYLVHERAQLPLMRGPLAEVGAHVPGVLGGTKPDPELEHPCSQEPGRGEGGGLVVVTSVARRRGIEYLREETNQPN